MNLLEHGQRQPGAAGREVPPQLWVRDEAGQHLLAPPARPRWQPALGISHLPQPGGQIRRSGLHPAAPRCRQAGVDEDVTAGLPQEGTRGAQQRSRATMADEDRGLCGCAAGDHLGLPRAIRRPRRDRAREVGDAHPVATPGQARGDQIPGGVPGQRAMHQQQQTTHALIRTNIHHAGGAARHRTRARARCGLVPLSRLRPGQANTGCQTEAGAPVTEARRRSRDHRRLIDSALTGRCTAAGTEAQSG